MRRAALAAVTLAFVAASEAKENTRVFPTPAQAKRMPNAACEPVAFDVPFVCAFGAPREEATRHVALLGDSHAVHWRAALGPAALARGWHGSSLTRAGCPFSTVTPILRPPLTPECLRWRAAIPGWFEDHPEIDTVFVSQHRVRTRGGLREQERGYVRAWRSLPATVKRIVVIRDTPGSGPAVRACVNRAIARREDAGRGCAQPRSRALHADPAAAAVRRFRPRRVALIDMTRHFCSRSACPPVIGGLLVHKDNSHITATYGATLWRPLSRRLARLGF